MSFQHFKSLLFKSARIEEQIEREQKRPRPDWMRLLKLKKLRLLIRDRLYRVVQGRDVWRGRIAPTAQPVPVRVKWRRN